MNLWELVLGVLVLLGLGGLIGYGMSTIEHNGQTTRQAYMADWNSKENQEAINAN